MDFIFDPGLVLYLPLYELNGNSFMSKDAYGHLCTVAGASWRPDGLYFDGVDDVVTITVPDFTFTACSILVWAKVPVHDSAHFRDAIGWQWDEDPYGLGLYFRQDTDEYNLIFRNTAGTNVATARAYTPDTWTFISKTWDGTTAYDGVNGVNYDGQALGGSITPGTTCYLGRRHGAATEDMEGTIGEIIVYNRFLTLQEIQRIYQATKWRYG